MKKTKRILVFEVWHKSPQYEVGLEIAEKHANDSDDVYYVNIGLHVPYIEWHMIPTSLIRKILYILRVLYKHHRGKTVLNKKVHYDIRSYVGIAEKIKLNRSIPDVKNITDLKNHKWNGFDLGMGVASSLISVTQNMDPSIIENFKLYKNIYLSSTYVYSSFKAWVKRVKPDIVYFRNGRLSSYRPILRYCQLNNIEYYVHDRGCNKEHYSINSNYRHDYSLINKQINSIWSNKFVSLNKKIRIAEKYYLDRRRGVEQGWVTFVQGMDTGILPKNWDSRKRNIVYFASSITEYAALPQEGNPHRLFSSQHESIRYIYDLLKNDNNTNIYLRLHPNLENMSAGEKTSWYDEVKMMPNLRVIQHDSNVDTYTLMLNADLVIVYISTTGVEASYYGKPVIIIGNTQYNGLDVGYIPNTLGELDSYLCSVELSPKPKLGSIIYAYYLSTYGIKHRYYSPISFSEGLFKGINLQDYPFRKYIFK